MTLKLSEAIIQVMNSATGLEFAYTQAPPSMKSVVQSFWLLTTCLGNIIDIFFVEIQLWDTQVKQALKFGFKPRFRLVNISFWP